MKILHTGDWHLREDSPYSQLDPNGRSSRFNDQARLLEQLIRIARMEAPDVVLIAGDVFHHRKPTPLCYDLAFTVLAEVGVIAPVVIIGGNHDGDPAHGQMSAVDVLHHIDRGTLPAIHVAQGTADVIQLPGLTVYALPHVPRSYLLAQAAYKDLSPEAAYQTLSAKALELLRAMVAPSTAPSVLLAHASVAGAKLGSERDMSLMAAQEMVLDRQALEQLPVDLILLGHIHRGQQMSDKTFYAGSLYRVSFDEEKEDKGVWIHETQWDGPLWLHRFIPLPDRPYVTLDIHGDGVEAYKLPTVKDAIVRVTGTWTPDEASANAPATFIRVIEDLGAHFVSWQVEVARPAAVRVSTMSESLNPAAALDLYLEHHEELEKEPLQVRGRRIIGS